MAIAPDGSIAGVVGTCLNLAKPFGWFGSGLPTPFVLPPGFVNGRATGVNSSHSVVGWIQPATGTVVNRAFIATAGLVTLLPLPQTTNESEALAINENGVVVGYALNTLTGPLKSWMLDKGVLTELTLDIGPTLSQRM